MDLKRKVKDSDQAVAVEGRGSASDDAKKAKTIDSQSCQHPEWEDLSGFRLISVLKEDAQTKTVCLHAKYPSRGFGSDSQSHSQTDTVAVPKQTDYDDAIILFEKTAFNSNVVSGLLSSSVAVQKIFNNDIYGTYIGTPPPEENGMRTTIIYPATAKHLEKYSSHDSDVIYESPEDYQQITLPWINASSFEMTWIYNILEKKKESEFIIFEDSDPVNGFLLLPDLKWDRKSMDMMYVSGIIHRRDVRSIRDLGKEHLPMLKAMLNEGSAAIEKEYGIPRSKIRAYFHYQPSYYHLHVHFTQIKYIAPGSNVLGAHLLTDVIDNIELISDYYQKKTLPFCSKNNTKLYSKYKKAGKI